jgi:hypothetical protein
MECSRPARIHLSYVMTRLPNVTPATAAEEMERDLTHFPSAVNSCTTAPAVRYSTRVSGFANRTPGDNTMPSKVISEPR